MIALDKIRIKPDTEPARERQTAQVCILTGRTRSQRRNRRVCEKTHGRDSDAVHRTQHLLSAAHTSQGLVGVIDQRTHLVHRQRTGGIEKQRQQVCVGLIFPQLCVLCGFIRPLIIFFFCQRLFTGFNIFTGLFVYMARVEITGLSPLPENDQRIFLFLCRQLHKQLIAVIKRDFTPKLVNLSVQDFRVHTRPGGLQAQFLLFFQIEVDKTICRTLKRVIRSIGPDRVVGTIRREKHFSDILDILRALRKIALAC